MWRRPHVGLTAVYNPIVSGDNLFHSINMVRHLEKKATSGKPVVSGELHIFITKPFS